MIPKEGQLKFSTSTNGISQINSPYWVLIIVKETGHWKRTAIDQKGLDDYNFSRAKNQTLPDGETQRKHRDCFPLHH